MAGDGCIGQEGSQRVAGLDRRRVRQGIRPLPRERLNKPLRFTVTERLRPPDRLPAGSGEVASLQSDIMQLVLLNRELSRCDRA